MANFNLLGTIPVLNEQLYHTSSGLHKLLCKAFNNLIGILYGPVGLEVFRLFISVTISSLVTGDRKKLSGYKVSIYSRGDLSTASTELPTFAPIEEKRLLNLFAISFALVISKSPSCRNTSGSLFI